MNILTECGDGVHRSLVLYARTSKGAIKTWQVEVHNNNGNGVMLRTISQSKLDAKKTCRDKTITKGKNIGRANETTPFTQAVSEAESKFRKKIDQDHYPTIEQAQNAVSIRPMLAHKYQERGHKINWPAAGQPKLDGVRAVIRLDEGGEPHIISREGKECYEALKQHPTLMQALKELLLPGGSPLDGELYYHGWSLQRIISAAKAWNDDTPLLEYWVYDIPVEKVPFLERNRILLNTVPSNQPSPIQYVETIGLTGEHDMKRIHDRYVQEGFEGLIIRNYQGMYTLGHRSVDLQKYKEFMDAEFEIIDTYPEQQTITTEAGIQKYTCIMFTCRTKDGAEFNCRPKGTLKLRQQWWNDREAFIGKPLTVRYQTLTDDTQGSGKKVPQFPVGICVRDYES